MVHQLYQIKDKIVQVIISPVPNIGATVLLHDVTLEKNIAQTKENFTYMVVHELRAPLTAIRGASAMGHQRGHDQAASRCSSTSRSNDS